METGRKENSARLQTLLENPPLCETYLDNASENVLKFFLKINIDKGPNHCHG